MTLLFNTILFLLFCSVLSSQDNESSESDSVKIEVYIFSVYYLDFHGNKISIDYYVWYFSKDSLDLIQYFEPVNAVEYVKSNETSEKKGELIYQTIRVNSKLKKQWDVTNFPFDKQTVEVLIEDYDKDNTKLIFIPDTAGSKIDKDIRIGGWRIRDFGIRITDHTYETNYGDPEISSDDYSTFSRAVVYFTIEREGSGLFFKLFIGLFISVLISLVSFFINPLDLDPRFGLSVGAIFAAIASQYVIASSLPQSSSLTLVDILHDIAYIYIFISITISTISLYYLKKGEEILSKKVDRYSFFILLITYIILTLFFTLRTI